MTYSFAGLAGEFPDAVPEIFELTSTDEAFEQMARAFEDITQMLAEAETSIDAPDMRDREKLEARRAELRAALCAALCEATGQDRWCEEAAGLRGDKNPRRSAA
ncbi:MAG: hypothetical protein VYC38_13530 [Pseudomonadota bacterium]|nr:hypothetical protein [Pseudomonadota bacterium]